ncbi:MAG TPA: methyltransferase type 11, partial [Dehalococcoidia bacterium]|nr:methyltransferase type 11 [Dehalococcoidia bacterium]
MPESETMLSTYDHDMLDDVARSYYDESDFYNYGYWQPGTRIQRQASENLIEKLLGLLPMRAGRV